MFDRPMLLWLFALAPLVPMPALLGLRRGKFLFGGLSALLRLLAFGALVLAFAGLGIKGRDAARRVEAVALIDQSRSIAPNQRNWMRGQVRELEYTMSASDRLAILGFGRDVRLLSALGDPRLTRARSISADPGATDIAQALNAADSLFSPDADKRVLLLTDGNQTKGDAAGEISSLVEDGVRVYAAVPPPSTSARIALTGFEAPSAVRANQRFSFRLEIDSESARPARVSVDLLRDGAAIGSEAIMLKPGLNRFELPYRMGIAGAYVMGAQLETPPPFVAINSQAESAITVMPVPRVLVAATAPPESLLNALKLRDYNVTLAPPRALPADPESYLGYQVVILSDASAATLSLGAETALNRYVADLGGGLVATGETLSDDHFAGSALEKTLPVKFVPQPPPPTREPIAVFLCIDRSNSMSYDSRYPAVRNGERIRYAKAAAIALLRQLDDTDFAGVIAFDSQPYVLGHLEPIGHDRAELENRIERLEPGGGTDFKEALEIAGREVLQSGIAVRQVFLLTDGDTNRQYHDHDELIADFARERIPVSTIRIGPDIENLRLLQVFAQATGGTFYRVQDIEKLPFLLVGLTREAMDRRKRGRGEIQLAAPSSILAGINPHEIPPIDYYATTIPKDGAQVALRVTRRDAPDPLLAEWQYGLGRAAVFTANPDSPTSLGWIRWNRYAQFWSQLVSWTMREGDPGAFTVRIVRTPDGSMRAEAEKADASPVSNLVLRVTGQGRAMDVPMTQVNASLYRGDLGPLARGKYAATMMIKSGDMEKVLVEREFASTGSIPADADELKLRPPNIQLLSNLAVATGGSFNPKISEIIRRIGRMVTVRREVDSYLLPFAIVLFLGEVFVRRRLIGE